MLLPDAWDIAVFSMYAIYDFSSAWEFFPQDELTPWAFYAIGTGAFGIIHGVYVAVCTVLTVIDMFGSEYRFETTTASISDDVYFWVFISINTVAILIPTSKLIWIFIEEEEPENGFFMMKTEQGKFNLEMEMYADIAKVSVLVVNYLLFMVMPSIAEGIAPVDKPANPNPSTVLASLGI